MHKVPSGYGPLAYFSDISVSDKNVVFSAQKNMQNLLEIVVHVIVLVKSHLWHSTIWACFSKDWSKKKKEFLISELKLINWYFFQIGDTVGWGRIWIQSKKIREWYSLEFWQYSYSSAKIEIFSTRGQRVMPKICSWAEYQNRHSSKSIRVIKLSFCQNDCHIGGLFWPKDSLITLILFELRLLWYLA